MTRSDRMATNEPLFPRLATPKAQAAPKKAGLLMKSLSFLMDDAPEPQTALEDAQIDYERVKITIRDRIVDALFKHLNAQKPLTEDKRNEIETLIKIPKLASLSNDKDTRYTGLKTLFDIRVRVPGVASSEPHQSWLGESPAYGVPCWAVRLSVIEPLLDTISPDDRQKLLSYIETCIDKGTEPLLKSSPFTPDHPCSAVFIMSDRFTQPHNIDIVMRAQQIPGKAPLIGKQLHHLKTQEQIAFINDTNIATLTELMRIVSSAQARAEEFCTKNANESLPINAMSTGDAFDDMCACDPLLMKLFSRDADDVKGRERWVGFLADMLNSKGLGTWPALNTHAKHIDIMRDHADSLRVIMDNLEHFSENKIKMFLQSFSSIDQMERFYNKLKEDFPESLKIVLPLPNFDALLQKAADAFKANRKPDYDTVVHTMRSRLEKMLNSEQKRDANSTGSVRGTQF